MQMQYFVIGAGSIGKRHHGNLKSLGASAELIGWRGLDLAALEKRLAALAPNAAMVIATATHIRLELIEICARLDMPFYVEKPLAFNRAELDRIYAAAAPVATRSVGGFMMRYHPQLNRLAMRPRDDIYGFSLEIGHDVRQWRQNWRFSDSYAAKPDGGGVLLDLCHELDMAHVLFPQARLQSVDCIGHADFPNVDFATKVTLAAENGPVGTVSMDYLSPLSLRRMTLRGREQVTDVDFLNLRETHHRDGKTTETTTELDRNDMFLGLMRDFMALAVGNITNNPLVPRLDHIYDSCALIADAWETRRFHGVIEGGMQ